MKKLTILFLLFLTAYLSNAQKVAKPLYKDPKAPVEARVKDLLSRMTLDEKILQLNQYVSGRNTNINNVGALTTPIPAGIGSILFQSSDPIFRNMFQKKAMEESRLGIPVIFGFDVIHGCRTVYPISLAQACSWNPELVTRASAMAAREARLSGIDWTFSPMIDVARDARWGRVSEGYGEDPYTNAIFGVATVKGYQGKSLSDPYSIAACLKHYVGYGESEGGRDYHYSDISMQSLWETYMVPYEACVKAGAATLMSAFNDISGTPASANSYILNDILKGRWKHDGFVVSDWGAIDQLRDQGFAADRKDAGLKAFMAGVEMDMKDNIYFEFLPQLIAEKKVPMEKINDAVARILRIKFRLGLFDQPYTPVVEEASRYLQPESKAIAGQLAAESMVLLKNKENLLPVNPSVKQVALIGPMAKDKANLLGSWAAFGQESDVTSIYDGLQAEFKDRVSFNYARGCDFDGNDEAGFNDALAAASKSDIVIVCLGEKRGWSGENASRSNLALPAIQEKLVQALKTTGKPIVLLLSNGRPLELVRLEPMANAILEIWQPGVGGAAALSGILSGRINPSGKLSITFPLTTGQIPTYYNMRQSARPTQGKYQDIPTEPLYWFGHGLSYTTFAYDKLKLSSDKIKKSEKLTVEVEVSNTGKVKGAETVLWYINDPVCSITRPMKELKYFEKKEIPQGGKATYTFTIDPTRDLSYTDANGKKFLETGVYYVIVNNQKVKFEVVN